jgi:hypothetical protein
VAIISSNMVLIPCIMYKIVALNSKMVNKKGPVKSLDYCFVYLKISLLPYENPQQHIHVDDEFHTYRVEQSVFRVYHNYEDD